MDRLTHTQFKFVVISTISRSSVTRSLLSTVQSPMQLCRLAVKAVLRNSVPIFQIQNNSKTPNNKSQITKEFLRSILTTFFHSAITLSEYFRNSRL